MPSLELGPATTYAVLLLVQALHLLHHRLALRRLAPRHDGKPWLPGYG